MKFNYALLFSEIERKGMKQSVIAKAIGMSETNFSLKKTGKIDVELSGTQLAIICEFLGSPMDMFVTKK